MTTYNGMTVTDEVMTQTGDNTLEDLLVCCRGNQHAAARILGLNRGTLRSMLTKKVKTIIRDGVLYKPVAYARTPTDLTMKQHFEDQRK